MLARLFIVVMQKIKQKLMKQIIIAALVATTLASCSNRAEEAKAHQQATIDSLKTEMVKKQMADSITQAVQLQQAQAVDPNSVELNRSNTPAAPVHHTHHESGGSGSYASSGSNGGSSNNTATAPAQAPQKKGWSAKAKGAVIGAGAGAVTGAMVDGRKGEGAIVGGLVGAASGLGVGAIIDKKQKDKEKQQNQK